MYKIVIYIDSSLDDLIEEIVNANNRGVSLEKNGSAVPSWSFGQSFFFSSTVVTTIGKIFFLKEIIKNTIFNFIFLFIFLSSLENIFFKKIIPSHAISADLYKKIEENCCRHYEETVEPL